MNHYHGQLLHFYLYTSMSFINPHMASEKPGKTKLQKQEPKMTKAREKISKSLVPKDNSIGSCYSSIAGEVLFLLSWHFMSAL